METKDMDYKRGLYRYKLRVRRFRQTCAKGPTHVKKKQNGRCACLRDEERGLLPTLKNLAAQAVIREGE